MRVVISDAQDGVSLNSTHIHFVFLSLYSWVWAVSILRVLYA